jgi:diguanylate cyclase (GGDEF)-like protein
VNDTHGHLIGDQVLINLANLCQQNIRSMDLFARFGGEEFVILMPDTDRKSAQETAERLRLVVEEKPMMTSDKMEITVTISLGIANWDLDNPVKIDDLLDRADQAMYQAKQAGRNRVVVWEKEE